jgi:hypothetical protein
MSAKQNIKTVCGMLTSKTSVTKALLKERAKTRNAKRPSSRNEGFSSVRPELVEGSKGIRETPSPMTRCWWPVAFG